MKKIYHRTLDEQINDNHKKHDKANTVFIKLLARQRKPKNPFDELRSYTLPIIKESKPGETLNDSV
jgi:hypothetical protein